MIIDSHAHLNDEKLEPIANAIVKCFPENGLEGCVNVGFNYASSLVAVKQAEKFECVYAAVGTHPHDVCEYNEKIDKSYLELSKNPKVVAIGEIGLDYYYDVDIKEQQKQIFEQQIDLAFRAQLPIILHIRDAYGDALEILERNRDKLQFGVLMHCYSSSVEMIREFNKFDCYYALGGAITFKNAKKEEVIKAIPKERLLVETDCPYMTPVPYRGQTNEPKNVNLVIDKIASVLELDRNSVIDFTEKNTRRLFSKIK